MRHQHKMRDKLINVMQRVGKVEINLALTWTRCIGMGFHPTTCQQMATLPASVRCHVRVSVLTGQFKGTSRSEKIYRLYTRVNNINHGWYNNILNVSSILDWQTRADIKLGWSWSASVQKSIDTFIQYICIIYIYVSYHMHHMYIHIYIDIYI